MLQVGCGESRGMGVGKGGGTSVGVGPVGVVDGERLLVPSRVEAAVAIRLREGQRVARQILTNRKTTSLLGLRRSETVSAGFMFGRNGLL